MLTLLGYVLLAIVLVAALFFLGATMLPAGEQLAPPVRDEPHWAVQNDRPVSAEDIENVRLPVALRGYRFAETDELLDTLADQIRWRDAELERLRAALRRLGEAGEALGAPPELNDSTAWAGPAGTDELPTEGESHADGADERAADPDAVGPDRVGSEAHKGSDNAAPRPVE